MSSLSPSTALQLSESARQTPLFEVAIVTTSSPPKAPYLHSTVLSGVAVKVIPSTLLHSSLHALHKSSEYDHVIEFSASLPTIVRVPEDSQAAWASIKAWLPSYPFTVSVKHPISAFACP